MLWSDLELPPTSRRDELRRKFDFNFARHRRRREIRTPCIRGMRVTVGMIVEALAAGRPIEQLLFDFPYLEEEDIREALAFAALLRDTKFAWRVDC